MRGVILLLVIALMAAALAACGGDGEPDGDGGGGGGSGATTPPVATEGSNGIGQESDRPTRPSDSATAGADDEDEDEPGPTRRGLLGSGGSQPGATSATGATEDVDGAVSTQIEDGGGPRVKYTSVSAGSRHTCGVMEGGSVACWGSDFEGLSKPPEGEFLSVSAGIGHTCGVLLDGAVACWGNQARGVTQADFE